MDSRGSPERVIHGAADLLSRTALFASLGAGQLGRIVDLLQERRFTQGDVVLREGEEGDEMYILRTGQVSVSKGIQVDIPGRGKVKFDKQLVVLGPGSYFGEIALLASDVRSATVTALSDLESSPMQLLMAEDTDLGYRLISVMSRELCHRLRRANEDIKKLMTAIAIALNR
jgi:CRP-like cAMP-binding protein